MKHLAIIPARSGSKRIPDKNIRDFLGKPMMAYSIEAALESGLYTEVMVSTDSERYAAIAKGHGASVPFFRSTANSNDFAGTAEVALEVLDCYRNQGMVFDRLTVIYPAAPLIQPSRLREANRRIEEGADSVFPVLRYSYPIERSLVKSGRGFQMKWPANYSLRSQDCEAVYHDAGQFYCLRVDRFEKEKKLYFGEMRCLELQEYEAQDVDTETDWKLTEMKYRFFREQNPV